MCKISPGATTKQTALAIVKKKSLKKFRCYIKNHHLMHKETVKEEYKMRKTGIIYKTKSKMADLNPTTSIIALIIALSIM